MKNNILRRNHTPFIDKKFRKATYNRNQLRQFLKNSTKAIDSLLKKQQNKCVLLRKKCIKNYFSKLMENSVKTYKEFWKMIKPFLINKCFSFRK